MTKPNICFLGNVVNSLYSLQYNLIESTEFRSTLYINQQDPTVNHLFKTIQNENHKVKYFSNRKNYIVRLMPTLSWWRFKLRQYDIVVVSSDFISLTPYLKNKTIFFPTGSDLTKAPFPERYVLKGKLLWIKKILIKRQSKYIRRGIEFCDHINMEKWPIFVESLSLIKSSLIEKVYIHPIKLSVDTDYFQPKTSMQLNDIKKKFRLLCPSRIIDIPFSDRYSTGSWKNQSEILFALKFLKEIDPQFYNDIQITFLVRDKAIDFETLRNRVHNFNLEDSVIFQDAGSDGLSKEDLLTLYHNSTIVLDDFGVGWFGNIVLEALSCGKPVITKIDVNFFQKYMDDAPIYNAQNFFSIAKFLQEIRYNPLHLSQTAELERRNWVINKHSKKTIQKAFRESVLELKSH